jgi:hypothetical protein
MGPVLLFARSNDTHYSSKVQQIVHKFTSVTPVVLPGSDDGLPSKTAKLLEKMLRHAGYSADSIDDLGTYSR